MEKLARDKAEVQEDKELGNILCRADRSPPHCPLSVPGGGAPAQIHSKQDLASVLDTCFLLGSFRRVSGQNRRRNYRGSAELKIRPGITKDVV